jgi:hypothetical protein
MKEEKPAQAFFFLPGKLFLASHGSSFVPSGHGWLIAGSISKFVMVEWICQNQTDRPLKDLELRLFEG